MVGLTLWFLHGDKAHAQKLDADPDEGFVGRCGIIPVAKVLPTRQVDPLSGVPPREACRVCLLQVGMDATVEEPAEEAKARGYVPVREDELAERGALDSEAISEST